MDCIVCFCPIEGKPIKCSATNCREYICADCMPILINYSKNNNKIPTCPADGCKSHYLYSEVQSVLDSENIRNYELACLYSLVKEKGEDITKELEQQKILDKLREEKRVFVQSTFPIAITRVANVALKHKLKALEKSKREHIQKKLNNSKRRCMNLFCKGYLNDNFECMSCQSIFCKDCEKLKKDDHVCKQEDVDALVYIKNMIHCPSCKLPIEKSQGCNNMTCANCGTHFDYGTGDQRGEGNEGANHYIVTRHERSISAIYHDIIMKENLMDLIGQIEAMRPSDPSDKGIDRVIKEYYNTKDEKVSARKLAIEIDKYVRSKTKFKLYSDVMVAIEEKLNKQTLDREQLHEYKHMLRKA